MFTKYEQAVIKRLKENTFAFGLLHSDEQAVFKKVGRKNCEILCSHAVNTEIQWIEAALDRFDPWRVYRIKSDFQPKPEEKYVEIRIDDGNWLCAAVPIETNLSQLASHPRFDGFYIDAEEDPLIPVKYMPVSFEHVAQSIREGRKVYVKLVEVSDD